MWTSQYNADNTVTWIGERSGGPPSGPGTLRWIRASEWAEEKGLFQDGKGSGQWFIRFSDGMMGIATYLNGRLQ